MIYFTADTYFCHVSIINLCQRPFANIDQMNERLIENWNSRVKANDEIYILGDFLYRGSGVEANNILERLKGRKYLIKGNHDKFIDEKSFDKNHFIWIKDYHLLKWQKRKISLFHYPIFEWDGYFTNGIHLYGHIHNSNNDIEQQNRLKLLGKNAVNVGVDVNNFFPISIEEIFKIVYAV
jgi:calcineurin-like phosphoesterase family protein